MTYDRIEHQTRLAKCRAGNASELSRRARATWVAKGSRVNTPEHDLMVCHRRITARRNVEYRHWREVSAGTRCEDCFRIVGQCKCAKKCDSCGGWGRLTFCPYAGDILDEDVSCVLCRDCYEERVQDI